MSDVYYPNDEAILSHICERLAHLKREVRALPPSKDQVAEMLSVAFAASLESDERRPVTFSMFYAPSNYPINYLFRERAPLSAGALVRLSTGLDRSRSNIAVNTENNNLKIVGIWHAGAGEVGLFNVRVVGAGVFVVKYGAKLILTYRRGQFVPYAGTHDSVNDVGTLLMEPKTRYQDDPREVHAVVCRIRIAEEMMRLGHGGTLLIVPYDVEWDRHVASHQFPPALPEERVRIAEEKSYMMWLRRQEAFQVLSGHQPKNFKLMSSTPSTLAGDLLSGYELREHLAAELDALAHLTATDGMVLILPDLTILGFGIFFAVKDVECGIELQDPYERAGRAVALSQLGGARHQSAAVAAARLPGTLAIVVSTDGTLTAMRRADNTRPLSVHKHLELRMPPWPTYQ
jgi:hypothetical protein